MPDLPHAYAFDPTYGYTPDALLAITPPAEPDDIEAFWHRTYAETRDTPLHLTVEELPSPVDGFRLRKVHFDGLGGVRLGAWLTTPLATPVDRYVVVGHGYYNRPLEDITFLPDAAALYFGCRGLGVSRTPGLSDQTALHVLHGIADKETYVIRGCVADTWTAASAMLELFPDAAPVLEYSGGSFGGGVGAIALAWERRFAFAKLTVPTFGHHPIRLQLPCAGSGEAVRRKWQRHPEIYDRTLRYFDAAAMAHRVKTPVACACALFDPVVPPPGQFAVYNALNGTKVLTVWETGHHDWAGTAAEVARSDAAADGLRRRIRQLPV